MTIDWTRCATVPREHQKDGATVLVRPSEPALGRVIDRVFLLADQVGCGKTKQQIDATQVVFEQGEIDTAVVVAPAFARGVWADPRPSMGEVAKHAWPSVAYALREYSVLDPDPLKPKRIYSNRTMEELRTGKFLRWVITNYEFIRVKDRLYGLQQYLAHRNYWLILDEGWALTNHTAKQFKAVEKLIRPRVGDARRSNCKRVSILNGSPADDPLDLYAQFRLLDRSILETKVRDRWGKMSWSGFTPFRAEYAVLRPDVEYPQVVGYQNLEVLREKVRPYILRRTTRDCWDLPPVLEPVTVEAKLGEEEWKIYKQMRDDMVAWLSKTDEASVAKLALTKNLRMMQILAGFVGGVQKISLQDVDPDGLNFDVDLSEEQESVVREIGRAKLDAMLDWMAHHELPRRLIVWCHFRPEIERTALALAEGFTGAVHRIYGQQDKDSRQAAVDCLNPDLEPPTAVRVVAQAQAGGAALNLSGANLAICMTRNSSLRTHNQRNGRIDRPGQRNPVQYVDLVATGPKGQRTMDHHILAALREGQDVATWTSATWRSKLMED